MAPKPAAQIQLEKVLERNRSEASRLLLENERIEAEMNKILSEPPPPVSKLVEAFEQGKTVPPSVGNLNTRMVAEKEVIYAALAIVRSWQRRHKKTYRNQERELVNAVERLTWEK